MIFRSDTVSFSTVLGKGGGGEGGAERGGGGCQEGNDKKQTSSYNGIKTSGNLLNGHNYKGSMGNSDKKRESNDKKKSKGRSGLKKKEKYEINPKNGDKSEVTVNLKKLFGRRHSTKIYDDGGIWKGADSDSLTELQCFNTGSNTDIHYRQRCASSTV